MQRSYFVVPDYVEAAKDIKRVTELKDLLDNGGFEVTPDYIEAKSLTTVAYIILSEVVAEGKEKGHYIMKLLQFYVDDLIKRAITEDINYIDSTTDLLIDEDDISEAYFVSKADGVLAGIDVAMRVFTLLDDTIEMNIHFKDGDAIKKGDVIAEFKGHTCAMLKAERTALNLLQHMSGIASYTNKCVKAVEGTDASIADTRKTLPPTSFTEILRSGRRRKKPPLQSYRCGNAQGQSH